uniref:HVA22-like protein n=2 Tax=Aegilops tauschii subsp. strangulata TaxID=200361 RepID=A0A453HU88_AEGTS
MFVLIVEFIQLESSFLCLYLACMPIIALSTVFILICVQINPLLPLSCRPLVALAYPLYASVKAIETKSSVDDQQWLTYWVLYSLITLFELTFTSIIEWLPFWSSMKLIFISWLVLPYFSGAAYVYQNYVRPVFVRNHMINIWYVPQKKGLFCNSDDFITALDKYIEENGPEALKKLADKVGKSSTQSGIVERVERIKIAEGV